MTHRECQNRSSQFIYFTYISSFASGSANVKMSECPKSISVPGVIRLPDLLDRSFKREGGKGGRTSIAVVMIRNAQNVCGDLSEVRHFQLRERQCAPAGAKQCVRYHRPKNGALCAAGSSSQRKGPAGSRCSRRIDNLGELGCLDDREIDLGLRDNVD